MKKLPNGPIPGENFTSDTRNYPWHRPAEFTDPDAAIEMAFKHLTKESKAFGLMTMISQGMTIAEATDVFLTSGIMAGKWTVDMAIVLAGPIARIIELMAKSYGVKYSMGIDDEDFAPTDAYFEGYKEISKSKLTSSINNAKESMAEVVETFKEEGPDAEPVAESTNTPAPTGFMA